MELYQIIALVIILGVFGIIIDEINHHFRCKTEKFLYQRKRAKEGASWLRKYHR
jgi:hypothetical protein